MTEEANWIQQAREGETAPFANLVRTYQAPVYNLAYRMTGSVDDAEDVLQETFLSVRKGLKQFRHEANPGTWIFRIASNITVNRFRRRQGETSVPLSTIPVPSDANDGPWTRLLQEELERQVQRALMTMSPAERVVFVLGPIQRRPYADIAGILSVSIDAVRSRVRRARHRFLELMKPYLEHGKEVPDVNARGD